MNDDACNDCLRIRAENRPDSVKPEHTNLTFFRAVQSISKSLPGREKQSFDCLSAFAKDMNENSTNCRLVADIQSHRTACAAVAQRTESQVSEVATV
jgi:hypothetical protein